MKSRLKFIAVAGFTGALLIPALGMAGAAAAGRHRHAIGVAHRGDGRYAARRLRHWRYLGRRPWRSTDAYAGGGPSYAPGRAYYEPGYVFVPGKGILGEDCDMPTSTCTNEYRDVQ